MCSFLDSLFAPLRLHLQASPNDPEGFPFVVLGNKVDQDGGQSRTVSLQRHGCIVVAECAIQSCLCLMLAGLPMGPALATCR